MNKDFNFYKLYIFIFYILIIKFTNILKLFFINILTNENEFSGKIVNEKFFDLEISKKYHYFNNNFNR